ncbi:MAG: TRM11 family SAM-dependent methyltransferase [Patescibacteria group bacterium]
MKKYLFVLGSNQALSVAEILSRLNPVEYVLLEKRVLEAGFEEEIKSQEEIKQLGGVVKIARVLEDNCANISENLEKYLPEKSEGKFKFGLSVYGKISGENVKKIAMGAKQNLKSKGISCSWVESRGRNLSSVAVEQNKLISRGAEFILVKRKDKATLAKTEAVQPFKELSFRDYGRPARDSRSGMIPPKLVQIMLNVGAGRSRDKTLLDPFCGSGTILMEALLMGFEQVIGSDVSAKAISDTQENIQWLRKHFLSEEEIPLELFNFDALKLSHQIGFESADIVVTEPYLGPQSKIKSASKIKNELDRLYSQAIKELGKILKEGGVVVMIWPVFKSKRKSVMLNPETGGFKMIQMLPRELNLKTTKRGTIIYGRKGQRVWREIVVLKK